MKAPLTWILIGAMAISMAIIPAGIVSAAQPNFFDLHNLTERTDGYYTMKDRADDRVLLITARILREGTEFIDQENRYFRVTEIVGDTAYAEQIETSGTEARAQQSAAQTPAQAEEGQTPKVGIYHSHGAESYVPSDGTESIDEGGGILDVGETFSQALEEQGVETQHEKETHVPHDAGAYTRSRRTAEELLTDDTDIIIDVHRDATPPEAYEAEVEGEQVTQILLVVGQQNQNMESNMQLAQDLKDIADENYPDLVKGILAAPGSYNQDLSPRSILIEVGAHENNKEDAEAAVSMFADVVNIYLGGEVAAPGEPARDSAIGFRSVLWLLAAVIAAVAIYLYIAAGSFEEFKRKITTFFKREFADLSRGLGRKRDGDDEG